MGKAKRLREQRAKETAATANPMLRRKADGTDERIASNDLTSVLLDSVPVGHPLWPVVAKIARSEHHLGLLSQKVRTFLDGKSYRYVADDQSEPGKYVWRVEVREPPDPRWGLLISEVVHHLHSALDHVAWLVAGQDGEPPKGTGFPIFGSRASYRAMWARGSGYYQVRGMPPHAQAIIEDVQPYHRGNANESHDLWVLRKLANADKHQALVIVGGAGGEGIVKVTQEGARVPVQPVKFINGPFKHGDIVARWPLPVPGTAGMDVHIQVDFTFYVALADSGPAEGREVIQTLSDMRNTVSRIIERLTPFVI
jgi:hypothetical protein